VVVDGELITPTLASGCLAGITRQLVLEWCEVTERDLPLEVLQEADEVFFTSTTRDVQGVHRIDDRELEAPGPVTAQTAKVFAQRAQERADA
jgi:branched-chain amino acid aminotransferase